MANSIYPNAKTLFMTGVLDLVNDDVFVCLVNNNYTYSATHNSYDTHILPHVVATVEAENKTVVNGAFNCDDVAYTNVTSGQQVKAIIVYCNDTPLCYIDTTTGLPFTTDGSTITLNFSNSAAKVFRL